jgi:hypothetical protein
MAVGKKTGGRNFVKGQSGNPNGRPRVPQDVKDLRIENRQEVERLVSLYCKVPDWKLNEVIADREADAIDKLVCRVILRGIARGDQSTLGFLTDFIFGARPKEIKLDNTSHLDVDEADKNKLKKIMKEIEEEV